MKTFISHSWENKTQAQQLADELKNFGADIWLDAGNLLPGQPIQSTIDEVLRGMDVVLLLWSQQANQSKGVAAEMDTAVSLSKLIIPLKLDATPLDKFPQVKQIKGISLLNFNDGLGRLKMVLLNYQAAGFDLNRSDAIMSLNEFIGALETADYLVQKKDLKHTGSNEDKD